ncbi:MAG: nucleotidyltransferase domain-containing protein [Nanoarchaeota archaeon]|nr:nucleotidyltransferase domain-containing protein [Nanoarchaeota archaeon]
MSQNGYSITKELLKMPQHIRGLAHVLKTNQMSISRMLWRLYKQNIVDFRQEGKNKVFFLKKTLEAKQYAFLYEHEKVLRTLEKYPRLRRIIEQVRRHPHIHLALIFGSYADGTATATSDIDLYVETENRKIKEELAVLDSKLSVKLGVFRGSFLVKEIQKNHLVVKGIEEYYERDTIFAEVAE